MENKKFAYAIEEFSHQIKAIAETNGVENHIGANMFVANIRNAGKADVKYFYHGADETDYAALQPRLEELEESRSKYYSLDGPGAGKR